VRDALFVDDFNGDTLSGDDVSCVVDFSERPVAEEFTDGIFVE